MFLSDRSKFQKKLLKKRHSPEKGAALIEFSISIVVFLFVVFLTFESSWILYHIVKLEHLTTDLGHKLSSQLGKAWYTNSIADSPWSGSCNSFLVATSDTILGNYLDASASDDTAPFYFGKTMDDDTAIVTVPGSPYALVRIEGRVQLPFLGGYFMTGPVTSTNTLLVEFNGIVCSEPY